MADFQNGRIQPRPFDLNAYNVYASDMTWHLIWHGQAIYIYINLNHAIMVVIRPRTVNNRRHE